jgi:hypothetical protein
MVEHRDENDLKKLLSGSKEPECDSSWSSYISVMALKAIKFQLTLQIGPERYFQHFS